ncbi:hypothetical protein [Candidatus Nitrosocosmicus sp. SS]|uniref:hypothetical protein n=1 Tax=Candidatus Nitrosocosmicus agrestis TaxID=2563600 RepID=UPI00122E3E83|nr:hypothetical protein [Candidatus Nitrosocosmicus sp. SS]KAA2283369.1 hypothetical protein F1Z66_02420 [Candidatus Nitrosocosmicus sp. SS]
MHTSNKVTMLSLLVLTAFMSSMGLISFEQSFAQSVYTVFGPKAGIFSGLVSSTATCETVDIVMGGGYSIQLSTGEIDGLEILESAPAGDHAWWTFARFDNLDVDGFLQGFARCLDITP